MKQTDCILFSPRTFVCKSLLFLLQSEVISGQSGIVDLQNDPSVFHSGSNDLEKAIMVNESWMLFTCVCMPTSEGRCPSSCLSRQIVLKTCLVTTSLLIIGYSWTTSFCKKVTVCTFTGVGMEHCFIEYNPLLISAALENQSF